VKISYVHTDDRVSNYNRHRKKKIKKEKKGKEKKYTDRKYSIKKGQDIPVTGRRGP
jgi:hypothetical protein